MNISMAVTCPNCKKNFDITYARAFACRGCEQSFSTCGMIKCPYCNFEFPK